MLYIGRGGEKKQELTSNVQQRTKIKSAFPSWDVLELSGDLEASELPPAPGAERCPAAARPTGRGNK